MKKSASISVVTPTLMRPNEIKGLIENLNDQEIQPEELIVVDGAPASEQNTEMVVKQLKNKYSFDINYFRHRKGTAIQRNKGIKHARGNYIAFIDDDIRLDNNFFKEIMKVYAFDHNKEIGGVVGYRKNCYFHLNSALRWRLYKVFKLLKIFEPSKYDYDCGYPINANMQEPFVGTKSVDFMSTTSGVWRREVIDSGIKFDKFFVGYGILEDAHFSLRAKKDWKLLQCGDAMCTDLVGVGGRSGSWIIGYRSVINYYYVFSDICGPLTKIQKFRFFRFQVFELIRIFSALIIKRDKKFLHDFLGRIYGFYKIAIGKWK